MTLEELVVRITELRDIEAEAWDANITSSSRNYHQGRRDALDNVLWLLKEVTHA